MKVVFSIGFICILSAVLAYLQLPILIPPLMVLTAVILVILIMADSDNAYRAYTAPNSYEDNSSTVINSGISEEFVGAILYGNQELNNTISRQNYDLGYLQAKVEIYENTLNTLAENIPDDRIKLLNKAVNLGYYIENREGNYILTDGTKSALIKAEEASYYQLAEAQLKQLPERIY
jgi:hypothetical protein